MIALRYGHHRKTAEAYCKGVLDDSIPAGRLVKLAVRRHLRDLETGHERGLHFDESIAADTCEFFPMVLRHSKGEWAGKPFELLPPQVFITWCLYGWRRESGVRRFTRGLIEMARKGGKSEFASGLALKHTAADDPLEPGAETYLGATKEDQVKDTTFKQCTRMVKASPALSKRIKCQVKALLVSADDPYQPNSVCKPIGSDSDTSDGFDVSTAVLDELHAWRKHHFGFYERMTTAGGSRRQELVLFFTTAGDEKSELWIKVRDDFVRTLEAVELDQIGEDHRFAYIACVDDDDDPLALDIDSPEFARVMAKANPMYPITPKPQYLRERASEGQASPLEANKFMRFHANRQVSVSVRPFPAAKWGKAMRELETPAESYGAFDLGRSDDFAAWAILWEDGEEIKFKVRSYTCSERPEALKTVDVAEWIKQGFLIEHTGNQVDFEAVRADMLEATEQNGVISWAYDEHFAKVTAQLMQEQLGENSVVKFVQSPAYYNEPCRAFLKAFTGGRLVPDDDPCLRWQAKNVSFARDARDRWMPDKGLGDEYKIDAMVAVLMAFGHSVFAPEPEPQHDYEYYDTHDFEVI